MLLRFLYEFQVTSLVRGSLSKSLLSDEIEPPVVFKFVPSNRKVPTSFFRGQYSERLRPEDGKPDVVLKFVFASGMLFILVSSALVRNEVEAENAAIELFAVVNVVDIGTAAQAATEGYEEVSHIIIFISKLLLEKNSKNVKLACKPNIK